jgi:hypothetical protein
MDVSGSRGGERRTTRLVFGMLAALIVLWLIGPARAEAAFGINSFSATRTPTPVPTATS